MFYAALDVSLRSVAICIIDHHGKICLERSVRSDVSDVLLGLAGFDQPIHQVGFEAGALTQPITYGLTEAGYDVVCMEARQVAAALSAMRNKTDKHDARGIAQILRCVSACKFGSDSNLLHVATDLALVSTRNQHDGSAISASQPCSCGIDRRRRRDGTRSCPYPGSIPRSGLPMS